MAAVEAVAALSFSCFPSSSSSSSSKFLLFAKPTTLSSLTFSIPKPTPLLSRNISISPLIGTQKKKGCLHCSTLQEVGLEAETDKSQEGNARRKLFVLNLPWSYTVADIKDLFGRCGNVKDVEIIKQKDGRNRNFAFVTMASGEEAQAAVDKLDSNEVSGRIIRVEFARRFKRPAPPSPQPTVPARETRHKLFVSNLAWKVRSSHLREFFSPFNLVSARVVFATPTGQSSGFGFVSFATKEEADAALSTLNEKELMDRPIRLKFSERKDDESGGETKEEKEEADGQNEES
ncbi:senescence-associated family protein [Hibiscus syriacus]|uniref:Senescence-associated family protein n=1 Tax=Hibiscus syriacus TaxID=106335 RepID=A0A6A3A7Y7_HIBSY|nr:28 kDa ribonucleoprotein, chloroplastic-like [Hibiscus syriacus]KAE8699907.1 senescence-associated family protein [Hibiscus syriacus]